MTARKERSATISEPKTVELMCTLNCFFLYFSLGFCKNNHTLVEFGGIHIHIYFVNLFFIPLNLKFF